MSRKSANRNRTLGAVGGAIALGGLGYYLYTNWSGPSSSPSSKDDGPSTSTSSGGLFGGAAGKKRGPPPSLSLSLPPTFTLTRTTVRLLQALVASVSQHYTVTLIVPSAALPDARTKEEELAVVGYLASCLAGIPSFDTRRIIEYGKQDASRFAVARALMSDAHCEVMLEACLDMEVDDGDGGDALFGNEEEEGGEQEDYFGRTNVDGDKTPRAASPARQVNGVTPGRLVRSDSQNHALNTALETYHAEMARIRKSSGLLIFLLLSVPRSARTGRRQQGGGRPDDSDMWSVGIESVLKPFLMPGQRDLSARVPGVKVIDGRVPVTTNIGAQSTNGRTTDHSDRSASPPVDRAWNEAAHRIAQLGQGWS